MLQSGTPPSWATSTTFSTTCLLPLRISVHALVSLERLEDLSGKSSGVQEGTKLRVHVGEVKCIHSKLALVGFGTFLGDA